MKAIFINYNFTPDWIKEYNFDYFIYDRSDDREYLKGFPQDKIKYVENTGSDIFDKFSWIIENYDNLPEVVLLSKSNLLKYISKEEFDKVKDNKTFTPLLTMHHKVYEPVCRYADGIYEEINNRWYLASHPCKSKTTEMELMVILDLIDKEYVRFAPGSNYILPKENILKHSKKFYEILRSYLEWDRYPGEAQIIERGLYTLWNIV